MNAPDDRPVIVLHVWEPSTAGVEIHGRALVADQRARGFHVHVLSPTAADHGPYGTTWEIKRRLRSLPSATWQLRNEIRRIEPDVVHLHSTVAGALGRFVVRGRIPTLFTPHAWSFAIGGRAAGPLRQLERFLVRWTHRIVGVGDTEAATGRTVLGTDRVVSVPNGIDLERFSPPTPTTRWASREAFGFPHDARIAVCVGRLTRQKGQDVLVDEWERVARSVPGALLVLAGAVPDDVAASDICRADDPSVRLLGAVDDVPAVMHAADIVVQPSRWEGLSYASIEALATGLPVVASDLPSIREVGGELFRYVAVDDATAWADAMLDELADTNDRPPDTAHDRRQRAEDLFDVHVQHDRLAQIVCEAGGCTTE